MIFSRKQFKLNSAPGITMMELMIALTLFGAMVGLLMSSFFQSNTQGTRVENEIQLRQENRVLLNLLKSDISSAVYLKNFMSSKRKATFHKSGIYGENIKKDEISLDKIHLHAHRGTVSFRGIDPQSDPEVHEVSYYLKEREEEKYELIRREEFYIDENITVGDRSRELSLARDVQSLDIKYCPQRKVCKRDSEKTGNEWLSSWDSSQMKEGEWIPAAIQISLKMSKENLTQETKIQLNLRPELGEGITWTF